MPDSYAVSPAGLLLIANGVDPMLRWDGLTTDAEPAGVLPPTLGLTLGASGSAGGLTGTYYAFLRFVDGNGNFSNLSPIAGPITVANQASILYSDVPLPVEPKVARRQILRNADGQTSVFYVDVDTGDLTSSTFSSTNNDGQLTANLAVPLFDTNGFPLANSFTVPPSWKCVLQQHLDRMFAAGQVSYTEGCVVVSTGSFTVSGIGTEWPATFAGRFFWGGTSTAAYQIASVDVVNQVLTLTGAYAGPSSPYLPYAIQPPTGERRLVYYTEAGQPESWPATNALSLQEDGDDITGLMAKGSFLFIIERRHIYRFTFQADPAIDGYVFLSGNRGCINQRCWALVDNVAYMLDEAGVHAYDGGQSEPLSIPIQDIFENDSNTRRGYRINWSASDYFHCAYYPGQEVVRWFVALSGHYLPQHALCFDIRQKRWWMEEWTVPVGSSSLARLVGQPKLFLGLDAGRVVAYPTGALDQASAAQGPVRGNVTSATLTSISDTLSVFASPVVGAPLCILDGRGKGQARVITAVSGNTLRVDQPWLVLPDSTSVYQVGGIQWRFRSGYYRWIDSEDETPRRIEIVFEPASEPCTLDARLFIDRSQVAVAWATNYVSADANGFASTCGNTDLVADLTKPSGFVQRRIDDHRELYIDGPRFVTLEIGGVSNQDPVTIYQITLDGASSP